MSIRPILGVIPARGGSKGLPGKNIRPLSGLPLLVHSIRCGEACPEIDRLVVSTDSEEIRDVAIRHGGSAPFLRPGSLAQDDTPMMPVLGHALAELERAEQRAFGAVLLLDPTSPGRLPEDVARAVSILESDPTAEGVIACSRPTFNPFWVGVTERNGYLEPAFATDRTFIRRQDVPPFYRINGSLYLWRAGFVRRGGNWRESPHRMLEIPEARAFSIDDEHELRLVEVQLSAGLLSFPWLEHGS